MSDCRKLDSENLSRRPLWIINCLLTLKNKDPGFWNQVHEETSPHLLLGVQDQWLGAKQDQLPCGSTGTCSSNCQEMETCISHATTAFPKQSFRAPWRVGDTVVGRGDAGWTTSKSGHICPSQNYSQGPPAEKTGRGSLLNCPSCPPENLVGQGTELNWTQLSHIGEIFLWVNSRVVFLKKSQVLSFFHNIVEMSANFWWEQFLCSCWFFQVHTLACSIWPIFHHTQTGIQTVTSWSWAPVIWATQPHLLLNEMVFNNTSKLGFASSSALAATNFFSPISNTMLWCEQVLQPPPKKTHWHS